MAISQTLKSRRFYKRIFQQVEDSIKKASGSNVVIEHVGGTSIAIPAGKGDVDIYVGYRTKAEMNRLKKVLFRLFGKPARATPTRIRFNDYVEGTQIEVQLIDMESVRKSVNLREYFNEHPKEAEMYATRVNKVRQDSLKRMWQLKESYKLKADRYWKSAK